MPNTASTAIANGIDTLRPSNITHVPFVTLSSLHDERPNLHRLQFYIEVCAVLGGTNTLNLLLRPRDVIRFRAEPQSLRVLLPLISAERGFVDAFDVQRVQHATDIETNGIRVNWILVLLEQMLEPYQHRAIFPRLEPGQQHLVLEEAFLRVQCGADVFVGRTEHEPMLSACHDARSVLRFVQGFSDSESIITQQSSVDHQLQLAILQAGTSLCTIIKQRHAIVIIF
uniref:Uncharacterized protein n=1 Tax=Anopheles farauti TaxID=69004 RepID=A0A182QZV6_9DIPT